MSRIDDFLEMLDGYEGRELKPVISVFYNGLEWQPKAYLAPDKTIKAQFYFDDSQEKLVQVGYKRHPFSAEAYGLIIAHLEGKLTPELDKIVEDMLKGPGELFCQAVETTITPRTLFKTIKKVTFYELVTALPRNANKGYDRSGMKYSRTPKTFGVSDLEFGKLHDFKDIYVQHGDLIEYLTSRKFDMLPDEIKETGGIGLPEPGAVWPVGRDHFGGRCSILRCGEGASRGVRPAKVKIK